MSQSSDAPAWSRQCQAPGLPVRCGVARGGSRSATRAAGGAGWWPLVQAGLLLAWLALALVNGWWPVPSLLLGALVVSTVVVVHRVITAGAVTAGAVPGGGPVGGAGAAPAGRLDSTTARANEPGLRFTRSRRGLGAAGRPPRLTQPPPVIRHQAGGGSAQHGLTASAGVFTEERDRP